MPFRFLHSSLPMRPARRASSAAAVATAAAALLVLTGCAVGPDYAVPDALVPSRFLEAPAEAGWQPAAPADAVDRGAWWTVFGDAELDRLAERVQVSNQNIAVAVANYAQARALVREQRASLFPSVNLGGGASRSGGGAGGAATSVGSPSRSGNRFDASLGVDWAPDVWGRLGRAVDSATAGAQASEADLASARLAAVGELVVNYFSLREADAEAELLARTIEGYARTLDIARNRYAAGVAAQSDVLQAQTQLVNAQAERAGLQRNRAQFAHAIAVLAGAAPADLDTPAAAWTTTVPVVPLGLPSTLLERRPDIAAAERAVASANAQIGIARSAYFPSLALSASYGGSGSRIGDVVRASTSVWSLGLSVAQVVFDAGATAARVEGARAAHAAAVARYRQAVLSAFQSVEDQLSALLTLAEQQALRRQASEAADQTEQQILNRYRAGQVGYTEVVAAQAQALNARRSVVQLQASRQIAAAQLVQALGGGWRSAGADGLAD